MDPDTDDSEPAIPPEKDASLPEWGLSDTDVDNIMALISKNAVTSVIAPTGSGKSTKLPEQLYKRGGEPTIFIVQPTVPAVYNLSSYMSSKIGRELVGTAAESEVKYNDKTKIVYTTSGHMKRKLLSYFENGKVKNDNIDICDVLVVDEAHNGSVDNDEIMALWKYAFERGAHVPRLVMASATLTLSSTLFPDAPSYEVVVPSYPVNIEYDGNDYFPGTEELMSKTVDAVLRKHREIPVPENGDSWLIFCSGAGEVQNVVRLLEARRKDETIIPLPAYSELPTEQLNRIFEKPAPGTRHVIVSTNIAEASITIEGLSGVFDMLTEKYGETSASGGFRLSLHNISKSSAQQRKGRTGRTGPGFCYRMCSEPFFQNLPEQRDPEIARIPLSSLVIEILKVGLDPETLFEGKINKDRLKQSLKLLNRLGMVKTEGKKLVVTPAGEFAPIFPLSVKMAAVLWKWIHTKKDDGSDLPVFPGVVIVSLIDCYGPCYFFYEKREPKETPAEYDAKIKRWYKTHFEQKYGGSSDLEVLVKLWTDMMENFGTAFPDRNAIKRYSIENSLNNKKIKELFVILKQVINRLPSLGYRVFPQNFTYQGLLYYLLPILRDVYSDAIFLLQKRGGLAATYIEKTSHAYYRTDNRPCLRPLGKDDHPTIIGLITAEIQLKTNALPQLLISLSVPDSKKFVSKVGLTPIKKERPVIPVPAELPTKGFVPLVPMVSSKSVKEEVASPKLRIISPLPALEKVEEKEEVQPEVEVQPRMEEFMSSVRPLSTSQPETVEEEVPAPKKPVTPAKIKIRVPLPTLAPAKPPTSPKRASSPKKEASAKPPTSPKRASSPKKEASAKPPTSPKRASSPKKERSPRRVVSPKRESSPEKPTVSKTKAKIKISL